jgi:hypothetical protein
MPSNVEMHHTVRSISITLDEAVAFYETYVPSGHDASLIAQINKSGFHPAFNIVSDALHRETIIALCRIWDKDRDTANLNRLAVDFCDRKVLADLKSAGHEIDPPPMRKWQAAVRAINKCEELEALRRARHRAIAHTATPNKLYKGKARVAQYGDERKVLERTIPLVEEAGSFIGYSYVSPFDEQRRIRKDYAKMFWESVKI